ncbi:carbohydrate kinase [Schaalia cardiffensis]|uniref:PfkB family carbohydrate kinase n=1 Tax=Schaalia cardiffensis TaxID=181487 RepID=UPI0018E73F29|nr:PfkB family carbohydrate kinase [Schaalia cardiffensis]MBJ2329685.1 carbohydrate kinase [Schaalia cardiffensis]
MTRILNIGEALIDEINRPNTAPVEVVGGSMLNVAAGLTRLGHESELATWFGRDERGDKVRAHAEEAGVTLVEGSDGAEFTTVAHATIDEKARAAYEFDVLWDVPVIPNQDGVGHMHTGSYAATFQPGGAKVLAAVKRQAIHGTVSYDPNIRPALLGTPDEVRPQIEAIVALSDVVKASDEDLEWLYPGRPVEEIIREWSQAGPALVLCTRGPWGVYIKTAAERDMLVVDPLDVELVDTVGAGDSLMAGLISGLVDADLLGSAEAKQRLREARWADLMPAIHRGIITSGITVYHEGAYSPTKEEVAAILAVSKNLRG